MGTDIYLSWNGMTEEEKEEQMAGFSINAGRFGYLRASIGMTNENAILREVFPDHWRLSEDEYVDGRPFDFMNEENMIKLEKWARFYLLLAIAGKEIHHEEMGHAEAFGNMITGLMVKLGADKVIESKNNDLRLAVMWLNSLYDFYGLGYQKQKEGKNPKIIISW